MPTVVVVDDEPLTRRGLEALLAGAGIRVVGAGPRGGEAVRLAGGSRCDLLVIGTPADMPRAELVRRVRELPGHPRTVVLLPEARLEEVGELLRSEVDGLARRVAALDEVLVVVERVLRGARAVEDRLVSLIGDRDDDPSRPDPDARAVAGSDGRGDRDLTARERDVLALLADGRSNRGIATELCISLPTVKTHLSHIYAKLDARNRDEALGRAFALRLIG